MYIITNILRRPVCRFDGRSEVAVVHAGRSQLQQGAQGNCFLSRAGPVKRGGGDHDELPVIQDEGVGRLPVLAGEQAEDVDIGGAAGLILVEHLLPKLAPPAGGDAEGNR